MENGIRMNPETKASSMTGICMTRQMLHSVFAGPNIAWLMRVSFTTQGQTGSDSIFMPNTIASAIVFFVISAVRESFCAVMARAPRM